VPHTAICLRNPDLHGSFLVLVTAMVQQDTANKKNGPPRFPHLPKERGTPWTLLTPEYNNPHSQNHPAKKLKSAWIQTRKIKSKWNAEKRRQGIQIESSSAAPELGTTASNVSRIPAGQNPDHQSQPVEVDTGSGASGERPVSNSQTIREPVHTAKTSLATGSSQQKDRRSRRPSGYQGKKPSMRNRMNALLEKIQREID
jgi:hypothetical protein